MATREEQGKVREAVRALLEKDRAAGALKDLPAYQRIFAGFPDVVEEEYSRLPQAAQPIEALHGGATTVGRPLLASTMASDAARPAPLAGNLGTVGSYRLVAELGAGGMGKVYRAVCGRRTAGLVEGQQVALKVVHAHLTETEGFFKRFLREAEIGKRVHHPNVVRTLDVDAASLEGKPVHYLVMEFVEGQTLRSLLSELGRVPEALCLHIAKEVGKGLAAIHQLGVVHRDFKPENVLITRDHAVKVMDLGVARLADEAVRLSMTGAFVGTVPYAAPEQFLGGGKDIDGRADLYALGLTLYELCTGQHPFHDEDLMAVLRRRLHEDPKPPSVFNPQLSPFFEEVVKTLVARDREKRFSSAAEMVGVLDQGEASAWWRRRSGEIRAETRRPLRRIRIPRETALFGREVEIARLRALWEKARSGEGQVVLLEGEAGIGKSRLADEFAGVLQREGEDLHYLFGSWPPGGAATASGALCTAFREQFGDDAIEETLKGFLKDAPLLVPAFAALLRSDTPPQGTQPLAKDSVQTAFVRSAQALAAERPTIVLLDDLHFAPEEGRALFMALAHAVPGHRVLFMGTARPGLGEDWLAAFARLAHGSRLPLSRLGAQDLARLLEEALHSRKLAEDLGGRIAAKTDGNPYFVFEILKDLKEGRFLSRQADGTWVTTGEIREITIPSTVRDLIDERLASLPEEDRELLEVAACCGYEFDPLLAGAVVGLDRFPLLRRLGAIEKTHRLIRSAGRKYRFDHHQVQEVLLSRLSEIHRESYHAAIGEALEKQTGAAVKDPKDLGGALSAEICEHHLRGGQGEKAVRYLLPALDHLEEGFLHEDAVALANLALGVPRLLGDALRAEVLLRKSDHLGTLEQFADDRAVCEEAAELAEKAGDASLRARALTNLGDWAWVASRYEEAIARIERAIALAREARDRKAEGAATGLLGLVLDDLGRSEEARRHCERYLALARETGDRRAESKATRFLGEALGGQSRYSEAREQFERSAGLARSLGDRARESEAMSGLRWCLSFLGRDQEAEDCLGRYVALRRELGIPSEDLLQPDTAGNLAIEQDRLAEALECCDRSLVKARALGSPRGEAFAFVGRARVLQALGRADEARDCLGKALAIGRKVSGAHVVLIILARFAGLELSQDRPAAARVHAEEMLEKARRLGQRDHLAWALTHLGRACVDEGRLEEADAAFREAATVAQTGIHHRVLLWLAAERTRLPGTDLEEALALLAEQSGTKDLRVLWLLWKATGDRAHLEAAHRKLERMVEGAPPEDRETMISRVPLHRDIAAAAKEAGL